MRVIFDKTFLSELLDRSSILEITEYSLVRDWWDWNKVTSVSDLFNESFVQSDVRRINENLSETIWEVDSKLLRLCIDLPKDREEDFIKNSYKFVYCYYKDIASESSKIAFILFNSDDIPGLVFDSLDFTLSKNLINVPFPKDTVAVIKNNQSENTKFLEGPGVSTGVNIFKASPDEDDLVSRRSYYTYLSNYKCDINNKLDLPYLNIKGEKVSDMSSYRTYSNLNLIIPGANTDSYENPTVDNLNVNGGVIQLSGTIEYQEYEVINGIESLSGSGVLNINELGTLKINCVSTGEGVLIDYSVDNEKKQIGYSKNTNPNQQAQGKVYLEYSYKNKDNRIEVIKSNEIIILQGESDGSWELGITTKFREGTTPIYLVDYTRNSSCSFTINTNLDDEPEFEFEDDKIKDFFDFTLSKTVTNRAYRITVTIKARNTNYKTIWLPTVFEKGEDEKDVETSKLMLVKVKLKNRQTQFYCVQKYEQDGMELHDANGKNITSIIFNNGSTDRLTENVYPVKIGSKGTNGDHWTLISYDPELEITPEFGKLNDTKLSEYFRIISTKRPETTSPKNYSNLVLARLSEEMLTKDLNDWRNYITLSLFEIPVSRKGESVFLESTTRSITLTDINVYRFLVKSNCPFECSYQASSQTKSDAVIFYDSSSTLFTSNNFNKSSGVYVYIKYQDTSGSNYYDIGNIYLKTLDGSVSVVIPLQASTITPSIEKLDPITDYLFLPEYYNSSVEFSYDCNTSSYVSCSGISAAFSNSIQFNKVIGGYVKHTTRLSLPSNAQNYPISPLGIVTVQTFYRNALNRDFINYTLYKKGNSPYITSSISSATIDNKKDSSLDITIQSRYRLDENSISKVFIDAEKYTFDYFLSYNGYSGGYHNYNLRLQVNQDNLNSGNISLGRITISSYIKSTEFISGEVWDQSFVDQMAPPTTKIIYVYQKGSTTVSIGVSGDQSSVSVFGEDRIFYVTGPETGFDVELSDLSSGITANYNSHKKQISATISSKFPKDYKPYLVKTDKSYVNDSLIKDTINSFTATIKSTTSEDTWPETIKLTQPGLYNGLLFRCDTVENTLFLANSGLNTVGLNIDPNVTEISLCAGIFNISKELSIGDNTGKGVKINSTDSDKSRYVYEVNTPAKYSETGDYNIKIKFPANTSSSAKKRTFIISGTGGDNSGVTHQLTLTVTQGGREWKVYPTNGELIKAHSSGYIINDLTSFSYGIETDIPEGNLQIWSDGINISEVTTKEEGDSSYGSSFKKISINFTVPENHTGSLKTGNLYIGYRESSTSTEKDPNPWKGIIKQGYFTVKLESTDGKIVYYPGNSIGTKINPIEYPERSSGVIPYPASVVQCEVTDDGILGEEIVLDVDDWDIITSDNDPGNGGNIWTWETYLNGELVNNGVTTYLDRYLTSCYKEYSDESLSSKCPFIANEYTVKSNGEYYRTELLFKVQVWIFARYPEDNGVLTSTSDRLVDNFNYIFWIKKKAAPEPEVSISPDSVDVSASGEDIEFTVTSNIELTLTPSSSWIKQKSISGNKYTYTIEANTGKERTGRITATNSIEWGDNSKSITINQAGK